MLVYAAITLVLVLSLFLSALWYGRRFYLLANLPFTGAPLPRLSVVVPTTPCCGSWPCAALCLCWTACLLS